MTSTRMKLFVQLKLEKENSRKLFDPSTSFGEASDDEIRSLHDDAPALLSYEYF